MVDSAESMMMHGLGKNLKTVVYCKVYMNTHKSTGKRQNSIMFQEVGYIYIASTGAQKENYALTTLDRRTVPSNNRMINE